MHERRSTNTKRIKHIIPRVMMLAEKNGHPLLHYFEDDVSCTFKICIRLSANVPLCSAHNHLSDTLILPLSSWMLQVNAFSQLDDSAINHPLYVLQLIAFPISTSFGIVFVRTV